MFVATRAPPPGMDRPSREAAPCRRHKAIRQQTLSLLSTFRSAPMHDKIVAGRHAGGAGWGNVMAEHRQRAARLAVSFAALAALAACGGGSSEGSGGIVTVTPAPTASAPTPTPVSSQDAVRLARQATFGPTPEVVNRIVALGINGWIDEQFAATGSRYDDIASTTAVAQNFCTGSADTACNRKYFSREPVAMRFYADAMVAPDQLRQRVAFALGQ
ncbi:MAG: DUF1800 domain-containing protein, partial [Sphingomonadales bacterium]|nr:DUF1800 domain-containing protein [Sphingomonadales bacterium]